MLYGKLLVLLDTCSATSWLHTTASTRRAGRTSRTNNGGLPSDSLISVNTMSAR